MGLPGAGKTTLANELAKLIESKRLNADEIRRAANDWDFSEEGRTRQSKRMSDAAIKLKSEGNNVIADFICPTPEARKLFPADPANLWMKLCAKNCCQTFLSSFLRGLRETDGPTSKLTPLGYRSLPYNSPVFKRDSVKTKILA